MLENRLAMQKIEQSYAGRLGKLIEPLIAPLGFDWRIGIGLIGSLAAREVFVATMGLVYGAGEVDETSTPLRMAMKQYSPLTGLSLLVFFLFAMQCLSTLAVVKQETKSWKWPAIMLVYLTVLAYGASFVTYQTGKLLGFA
jgi:ferrous iron transport protein B